MLPGQRSPLLIALLFSLSGPSPALAQLPSASNPPEPPPTEPRPLAASLTGEAKQDYELGRLLYENRDYAGALARFERAYEASNDVRLLWNAAVCHKGLHQYAKAISAMRRYLNSNSTAVSAAAAASARNFLAAAEALTARLEVSSDVGGSVVFVDGERLGSVPLPASPRLDWGTHQIVVKKPDYTEYQQTVTVQSSAELRVAAVLRPVEHQGRIVVRAGSGDLIAIDGTARAWGTWEGVLTSGSHVLRVSAGGFRPHQRQIVVADAQTQGFDIRLQRAPGSSLPTWVWLVGGGVLAAGALGAGYLILKPADPRAPYAGSISTVQLDLR